MNLNEIEARCNAATDWGEWYVDDDGFTVQCEQDAGDAIIAECLHITEHAPGGKGEMREANANFIAHARTDVPRLVARVRELEAQVESLGYQLMEEAERD